MIKREKKTFVLLVGLITIIYFLINGYFLLKFPPPWPDETEYADVALNLIEKNQYKMSLHPFSELVNKTVYTYPPLMFYVVAASFKIFGFSLFSQRIISMIAGVLFLLLFYIFINKYIFKNSFLSLIPIFLLVTDLSFTQSTRISRPEIYIMLLTILGYFALLKNNFRGYFLSGLFFGLSALIQPYGVIGFIVACIYTFLKKKSNSIKKIIFMTIPFIIAFIFWMWRINFNFQFFIEAMKLQGLRKSIEPSFFYQIFHEQNIYSALLSIVYLISSSIIVFLFLKKNSINSKFFLVLNIIIYWYFVIKGKQFWYFVYPIPWLYTGLILLITSFINKKKYFKSIIPLFILILIFFINLRLTATYLKRFWNNNYSYKLFTKIITKQIPNNSRVFISTIPNPYYELKKNKTLKIFLFPALPGEEKEYLMTLENSDYIIYNGDHDLVYGNLLKKYIEKEKGFKIDINNGLNQYKAVVLRMQPKN